MIADLSQAMAFTPIDDSQVSLSLVDIHQHIGVVHMLGSDGPIMVQCCLGVRFVGVPAHELKKLLRDVQSPFGHKQCSHMSTKTTQLYVGDLTVGHQTSNVTQQSPPTGPYIQVVTIGRPPLDVAWRSLNLHLTSNVTASPDTIHVSLSLEDSPLATICPVAPLGTLLSTHRLVDVFATMKTFGVNDGEGTVTFDFEPALDQLSCPTTPSRQESLSDNTKEEDAYPTL